MQDSHLTLNNAVEVVGKVQQDLSIRVFQATDFGDKIGKSPNPFVPLLKTFMADFGTQISKQWKRSLMLHIGTKRSSTAVTNRCSELIRDSYGCKIQHRHGKMFSEHDKDDEISLRTSTKYTGTMSEQLR